MKAAPGPDAGSRAETGLPAAEAEAARALYEPLLQELAAAHDNLVYRPIFDGMCKVGHCALFDGETPQYHDGDHLSAAGALKLAALLRVRLFTELRGSLSLPDSGDVRRRDGKDQA